MLWGFELMDSDPDRTTNTRPNLIVNDASHTKYINLILHDGGIGWYTYATRSDVEVTGCIFFNNGWDRAQGGGHAIYAKSNTGPLVLRDNVAFDQFGYGLHIYTEPRSGLLNNIRLEGNVVFNNGTVSQHPEASNILVGGPAPADAIVVRDNMTFYSPGVALVNARFGWRPAAAVQNGSLSLTGNTFVGGRVVLDLHAWRRADVSGNAISAPGAGTPVREDSGSAGMPGGGGRGSGGVAASLVSSEQVINRTEPSARVVVRPNPYEPGRGTIVVYNWGGRDTVSVDPSGVLQMGDSFELRDVQDLFGAPVARGTYSGAAIRVSMAGVDPPLPIGEVHAPPLHRTGPGFGVFILERARK